jgi:transposase-like protein
MIVADFGWNVQVYAKLGKRNPCPRPVQCPWCGCEHSLIGHGYYRRKAKDDERAYTLWVKRWLCKGCGRTLSVLPNFLLNFRHYLVGVIQAVMVVRFEDGQSWAAVERTCANQGTPALRTMQRWCRSLTQLATRWLGAVQETLASQDSGSPWLDPQGEAPQAGSPAQALLAASLHLLAWGQTQWTELAGYGRGDRLGFLWLWGAGRGLGRLV